MAANPLAVILHRAERLVKVDLTKPVENNALDSSSPEAEVAEIANAVR